MFVPCSVRMMKGQKIVLNWSVCAEVQQLNGIQFHHIRTESRLHHD